MVLTPLTGYLKYCDLHRILSKLDSYCNIVKFIYSTYSISLVVIFGRMQLLVYTSDFNLNASEELLGWPKRIISFYKLKVFWVLHYLYF